MAKEIPVIQVLIAYEISWILRRDNNLVWPEYILTRWTGESEQDCLLAMNKASENSLVEYGVSLRSGWVTDKGRLLLTQYLNSI